MIDEFSTVALLGCSLPFLLFVLVCLLDRFEQWLLSPGERAGASKHSEPDVTLSSEDMSAVSAAKQGVDDVLRGRWSTGCGDPVPATETMSSASQDGRYVRGRV